jgi:phosphoenolpyruvate synthase/pyruvate phosphate dikinase
MLGMRQVFPTEALYVKNLPVYVMVQLESFILHIYEILQITKFVLYTE